MFSDIFEELCARAGKSTNAVLIELGLNRGANTSWKNGSKPSNSTKAKTLVIARNLVVARVFCFLFIEI